MGRLSAIKLKRTDTTLDLSQDGKSALWEKRKVLEGDFIGGVGAGLVV